MMRALAIAWVAMSLALVGCDLVERIPSQKKQPRSEVSDDDLAQMPALSVPPAQQKQPVAKPPSGTPQSFADLADRANPSVVFVRTVQAQRRGFRRVFQEGSGSGFVFDASGKILTNHHVVGGADAIQVELHDGRLLMAGVVGADPLTDLAVLQVEADNLPALALGDSDHVRVGDWVVAIGNPFGLEHTVSAGIISAKERTGGDVKLGDPNAYYSFLQTDASINPGNSGGPLLDLGGQVVGINTAINQTANNIGFAIPVNMVRQLLPRLLKDGRITRAAIGVHVGDVTPELMERFKLPNRKGAMIGQVVPRSPAAAAQMEPGDVVIEFHGEAIDSPEDLRWNASLAPIGDEVELTVLRGGKKVRLKLKPAPLRLR